jgi:hypothetical protein
MRYYMKNHKLLKLIAGVNSRKQIELLIKYFEEKKIDVPDDHRRTLMNKYYMLPKEESDSAN